MAIGGPRGVGRFSALRLITTIFGVLDLDLLRTKYPVPLASVGENLVEPQTPGGVPSPPALTPAQTELPSDSLEPPTLTP